jgi:bacterial/archaeal transporter family protein
MHLPPWLWYVALVLAAWGIAGIFQKLSTNHISAESLLVWLILGFCLFQPFVYPDKPLSSYSTRSVIYGLLSGLFSNVGAWGLFAALKSGGKASIVCPLCALYPLLVVIAAPFVLNESLTLLQGVGVLFSLASVAFLSS